ncbi:hypothetical protein Q7P35_011890 [Cladosporium inversicolor]
MTAPDPSERGDPASSAAGVQVPQHNKGDAYSPPQEEHQHDLRPTNDDHVARGVHSPHAERFEPKEENWLLGNIPIGPLGVSTIIADCLQTDSGAHEGQSVSHVGHDTSITNEAPVNGDGAKCYYCIASNIHAPHLHNVQLSQAHALILRSYSGGPLIHRTTSCQSTVLVLPWLADAQVRLDATESTYYRCPASPWRALVLRLTDDLRRTARDDDPKGKRRATSTDNEGSRRSLSAAPSPSDHSSAASSSSSESDDDTVAGDVDDADDDQSSDTTAPSASAGTLDRPRKRRRHNSTVDNSRPRSAGNSRVHQRRRLERSMQRAHIVSPALPPRASCACVLTLSSDETTENSPRAVVQPPLPRATALETLEQSHQRVTAYLSSCFASNQRLRAELAEARGR